MRKWVNPRCVLLVAMAAVVAHDAAGEERLYNARGLLQLELGGATEPSEAKRERAMQNQMMMLTSRSLMRQAVDRLNGKIGADAFNELTGDFMKKHLTVGHQATTDVIELNFMHRDPQVANVVLRAVVDSYQQFVNGTESMETQARLRALDDRRGQMRGSIARIDAQRIEMMTKLGATNLEGLMESRLSVETKLELMLADAEVELGIARRTGEAKPPLKVLEGKVDDLRAKLDAVHKDRMELGKQLAKNADLLRQREETLEEMRSISQRMDAVLMQSSGSLRLRVLALDEAEPSR